MIEVPAGVLLTVHDVRALLVMLDDAKQHVPAIQPRAAHTINQLRAAVGRLAQTTGNAQCGVTGGNEPVDYAAYDLVDSAQAATILGITPGGVRYLADAGILPAHRAGGRWLYPARAVVERAEQRASRRSG